MALHCKIFQIQRITQSPALNPNQVTTTEICLGQNDVVFRNALFFKLTYLSYHIDVLKAHSSIDHAEATSIVTV